MSSEILTIQADICKHYQVDHFPSPDDLKVGISLNVKSWFAAYKWSKTST